MANIDTNAIKDSIKVIKELKKIEDTYGRDTLKDILESINTFFELPVLKEKEDSFVEKERTFSEEKTEEEEDKASTEFIPENEVKEEPKVDDEMRIYAQEPNILKKVQQDKKLKNEQVQSPLGVETEEIEQVLPEEERAEEEITETEEEDNNPWSSAGSPVSPGQLDF